MPATIVIRPRGDSLDAVTAATRAAVELELVGLGCVLQVWTWRNGEAVVARRQPRLWDRGDPVVFIRRGLRRGAPVKLEVDSIASALRSIGLPFRNRSARRPPAPPSDRMRRRRALLPAIHAKGNRWRTLALHFTH